jgi:FKBP-type peptidyl-prolyl cis-trans isomerase
VYVKYIGKLENDMVFDQSVCARLEMPNLIPGFRNGVVGMKPGEEKILTVPPEEGYRDQQVGSIPPNSTLLFAVKLLSVE